MESKSGQSKVETDLNNPIALGGAIAKARQACDMTQKELCKRTGIAYSTLTKIERGAIKKPNVFTVLQIAQATNLKIEELLRGSRSAAPILNPHMAVNTIYDDDSVAKQTSQTGIKFVYFDLHQVLVNSVSGMLPFLAAFTNQPVVKVENLFLRFDRDLCLGRLSSEEFNQIISKDLGKPDLKQLDFYVKYVEADVKMREIFDWVSQNYQVGLLTNAFPGNVSSLIKHKIIPESFDVIVDSSVIGKIKPEKEIYEHAQELAKVSPKEILLIDDRLINIVGAQACGWQGFWVNEESKLGLMDRLQAILGF